MMETWRTIRLGSACTTNSATYSPKEKWEFVNYLDTGNITNNRIDSIQYIDVESEKLPSRARRKVKTNSIVYSTVRPRQRHFGIIKSQPDNFLVSTGFAVIDVKPEILDADYLYYVLTQDSIVEKLHAIAEQSTSAYPSIKSSDIEDLEIEVPDLATQKKIAGILGELDRKAKQNAEINKNLQTQAQSIYTHMIIDEADESCGSGVLSDIATITMGQSPKGDTYNEDGIGTVFFQGRAEFGFRFPTRRLYTTDPKRMAQNNDVLMSVRAPVGDLNVAYEDCCIGRGLGAIHSKDNHQSFVLYTMFALRDQLDVFNGEGTVFGSINRDALKSMPVSIPSREVVDKFESIVSPMDAEIKNNYVESCHLQAIRDSLLPRLMSGELDVSDLDL
ncbi:restriction endonuclease subunit S [Lachnospiraceae bacterium YH-ros2228]